MNVYCIIVTYNGKQWIEKCLKSLRESEYPVQIIAVDNGSTDGTLDLISDKFPEVRLVRAESNLGFGKGNNLGIETALHKGADFVFLLNQDAYILRGCITSLLNALKRNAKAGLISPIHLAGDERNFDFGFYNYINPRLTPNLLGDYFQGRSIGEYETEFVNAAAWLISADVLKKAGMFHPAFDHYGEDREYTSRLQRLGYKILIDANSFIVHDRIQNRVGNEHHRYGQKISRDMLQALIEQSTTITKVSLTLFKLSLRNIFSFRFGSALEIVKCWLWLLGKNRSLKG